MKYKSALLTQASGSLGGMVASHNKGGAYLRARVIPTNPASIPQQGMRSALAAMANKFQDLSDAERQSWEDYADAVQLTDRLGESRKISAINHFIRSNAIRFAYFGIDEIVTTAPTEYNMGAIPVIESIVATYQAANELFCTINTSVADAPEVQVDGDYVLMFASPPQPASVKFFKGPFLYVYYGNVGALAAQPVGQTIVAPGNWKVAGGDKVFIRCVVTRNDGRLSSHAIGYDITGPHA